jgi:signal transduction histidine kinase/ActR/RegA family two-component response regulator
MDKKRLIRPYMWAVIAAGAAVAAHSALHLPVARLDLRFALIVAATVLVSPRFCIPIPRTTGQITVSDALIFLTMLLYGGEAAVFVAAADLFAASRFGRWHWSLFTSVFNGAMMACSTFLTVRAVELFFGDVAALPHGDFSRSYVAALCVMALVQYVANSAIAATHTALKVGEPLWLTWRKKYLWASVTYFAGASAAGIIVKLVDVAGVYALVAATPIVAIVYLTYRTYLENIEAMSAAAVAEAAARSRAEAAAAQAEQAERHVEELSHYIAEQDRIREQYAQIEKLSALGELASGVAHDFNNTLAGILGRAQLLLRTNDPEKIRRGLNIIIKSAEDGARTVRRIQDFARQRRDKGFEPLSVEQLLHDVREMTRPRWKDRAEAAGLYVAVEVRCRPNVAALGDGSELREVLVNMVFNAVDAMPDGGTITLASEERDGTVEISVADTGTGMTEDVRTRVFDPFYTTKGKAGLGLGLAVSYGIVRRHEGTIEVESEPGKGSVFRIKLPAATASAARVDAAPQSGTVAAESRGARGARILVVDDEPAVRELLGDVLTSEGFEAVLARGGREALEQFDAGGFDAVFTDIGMPGMSGWELAGALRERDEGVPIAVITGWGEAVGSSERRAARVDWVVTKPFTSERILELARAVSQRRSDAARGARLRVVA